MKVGADDSTLYRSLCSVDAVVAGSPPDPRKWRGSGAQGRPPAVVLKPDQLKAHLVEVAERADCSDDAAAPRRGRDVEERQALHACSIRRDVTMTQQLVPSANSQDHGSIGEGVQEAIAPGEEIIGERSLDAIGPPAQDDEVRVPWHRLASGDPRCFDEEAAPFRPSLKDQDISSVTVRAEKIRVEVDNMQVSSHPAESDTR